MKPIVVLLLVGLFAQVVSAQDTEKKEPAALTKAREGYQKDILPLTKAYITKLEALKKELGGKGDLEGATAVQAEIDVIKPDDDGSKESFFGKWKNQYGVYEFRAGGRAWLTYPGGNKIEGKWILTGKQKLSIVWTNGITDTYSYPPEGGVLTGTCSSGAKLSLRRQ